MHSHPEIGFKEFITRQAIKDYLLKIKIPENSIKTSGKTGWTIDIYGKGTPKGENKLIALRADIDALSMTEANENLEYRSTTGNDHACGHDVNTKKKIYILILTIIIITNYRVIRRVC